MQESLSARGQATGTVLDCACIRLSEREALQMDDWRSHPGGTREAGWNSTGRERKHAA